MFLIASLVLRRWMPVVSKTRAGRPDEMWKAENPRLDMLDAGFEVS
jgi:hypothetical protein